jgi:hypothetical protein
VNDAKLVKQITVMKSRIELLDNEVKIFLKMKYFDVFMVKLLGRESFKILGVFY